MLKVVSNTTPILSLLKIEKLDLLQEIYGEIIIPKAVFSEIQAGINKPFFCDLSALSWVKISAIRNEESLSYFLDLDRGEAETIILAKEISADLVLIDESLGRFHAKHADLRLTGTLGVLLKAKSLGRISSVRPLIEDLVNHGIWLSKNVIAKVLTLAGEK